MRPNQILKLFSIILIFNTPISNAAQCSAKSSDHIVPLLELYTSEGCSSCPPADKWLSSLDLDNDELTALAFHVDYWDYIGWKDRFAKPEYSDRQRNISTSNNAGFVYTPQFTLNGKDFRHWGDAKLTQAITKSKDQKSSVRLSLIIDHLKNDEMLLTVKASAHSEIKSADIFIALYENNLLSDVRSGENSGNKLKHDYVVRDFIGSYQFNGNRDFSKDFTLKSDWKNRDGGAVLFVQTKHGAILQSLRLPFCDI